MPPLKEDQESKAATIDVRCIARTDELVDCPDELHKQGQQLMIDTRYRTCLTCGGTTNNPKQIRKALPVYFKVGYYGTLWVEVAGQQRFEVSCLDAELVGQAIAIRGPKH